MGERTIIFRGKRTDNGEWVEGYYACESNHACFAYELKYHHYIFKDVFLDWNLGGLEKYEVIPETIGQYTGLCDKNGKKIFEGDVAKNIDGAFLVCWDKEKCAFIMRFLEYPYETLYLEEMWEDSEIIGNIHDNPELLKGGAE